MHAVFATLGTDGDIFPHIALGAVMRERGHQVTIAAPENYRAKIRERDLEFFPLVSIAEVDQMLSNPDLWHPFRSGVAMARWGGPMIPRQYGQLLDLTAAPETVLIANPGILAARLVQETHGRPMASLLLQPGMIPSCIAPPQMPGGLSIPPWLPHPMRRLYWLSVDLAAYGIIAPSVNRVRKQLGLRPVRRFFGWWLSPELVIGLFPAWYAERPKDWPVQLQAVGFPRFDGVRAELSDDLRSFCAKGSPPIVWTLGTGMRHAREFFTTAVKTCEILGARGLLLSRFDDVIPSALPQTVRHCAFAPFRQLLPHCRAIVHHGGVGTTAAALESGCPQLILPLAWDQPDNAARVSQLGVGKSLSARHRTPKLLAASLEELAAPMVRKRCQAVAQQAQQDQGLERAAVCVERFAAQAMQAGRREVVTEKTQ